MEREREEGEAAAGLGIKTGDNPLCIVQHQSLPPLSLTLPLGALCRDILQTAAPICQTTFSYFRQTSSQEMHQARRSGQYKLVY